MLPTAARERYALEVAPIGQTLRGLGPSQLVEREALRSGTDDFDARPMRDLEARPDLDTPILQLGDGQGHVGHAADEHRRRLSGVRPSAVEKIGAARPEWFGALNPFSTLPSGATAAP
jgi:hypothetical protein